MGFVWEHKNVEYTVLTTQASRNKSSVLKLR